MSDQPRLLKAPEVAKILRVSRTQVYRMMNSGELPCIRFGTQIVRIRESDLLAFIEGASQAGPSRQDWQS